MNKKSVNDDLDDYLKIGLLCSLIVNLFALIECGIRWGDMVPWVSMRWNFYMFLASSAVMFLIIFAMAFAIAFAIGAVRRLLK